MSITRDNERERLVTLFTRFAIAPPLPRSFLEKNTAHFSFGEVTNKARTVFADKGGPGPGYYDQTMSSSFVKEGPKYK